MPTYKVTTANLALSQKQKSQIASAITTAHHSQTGAPGFLAQVFFSSTDGGDHFIGGSVNVKSHIFVSGLIRQGRSADIKQKLMDTILRQVSLIAGISVEDIWIYLQEIPSVQMIEFGRFLPAPGEEEEWKRGLSPEKQADLANANVFL
ncbi:Phenylpyruvate tautomerase PptA, 4-oxalocrotonate tautomerase family [Marinobacter daqiaonensis]|uniref:Phenylpyruvate tautomerase PptA, 4-oxalocrotonate tautomerase family n=2 Tax=Marinobacter daqiaonensis TaxID=650891 RepID=A0A1I6I304_9GAMM|nr:Phenylpyruvate tautomerase PptA, 4-oxalocrotonate tautomerase family [Marinobacter daqiaonensis]